MSTIYQKIKDAAEKKRRSFVSLGSEDGTASPTKLNQTLVQGSAGIGKKFVNHADALMEGYNDTLDEDGATFMDDFHTDFSGAKYRSPSKFKSPAKGKHGAAGEAGDAVAGKPPKDEKADNGVEVIRTDREGTFSQDGNDVKVTDIRTTTAGKKGAEITKTGDFSKEWDTEKYGPYSEWIKKPGNQAKSDKFIKTKQEGTGEFEPDEADKIEDSVEMVTTNQDKTEVTPGTEANYSMGLYESRNVAAGQGVQRRHKARVVGDNNKIVSKWRKRNKDADISTAPKSVQDANDFVYVSPFNQAVRSTKGRDTKATSETTPDGKVPAKQGSVPLDVNGKPIVKEGDSPDTYKKTTASPFKMKGAMYNKNKK